MADSITLAAGDVHAWHGRIAAPGPAPGPPRASDLVILSADERARGGQFIRPADRVRFAAAHAGARRVLARYLAAGPAELRFGRTPCCQCGSAEHGPPRVDWPPTDIAFNLSRSADHWLLAVARGRPVGADIEVLRDIDTGELAPGCLTAAEQQYLSTQPADGRLPAFYRCWTRKEAVLKACGIGLAGSMRELEVAPGQPGPVLVPHRCADGPDRWVVQDLPAPPGPCGWLGAVAQPAAEAGRVWLREADDARLA